MSDDSIGIAGSSTAGAFCSAPGSLQSEFEAAIANILGPGAYFDMIRKRTVGAISSFSKLQSTSTPIKQKDLAKAEASAGFQRLNDELQQRGYKALLTNEKVPSLYLRLNIGLY